MALVNQIQQMKSQGMGETDIIKKLQDSGYSPLEINQAIEQSKIRSAISQLGSELPEQSSEGNMTSEMQPSVMESPEQQEMSIQQPTQYEQYAPQQQQQYYYPQEQGQQYQQYQSTATENVAEITEQIIEEKIDEMRKKILEITSFRILTDRRIKNLDERLKAIESFIRELEIKILGKIGTYSESLQDIQKEMTMMQDSFGKVINPLMNKMQNSNEQSGFIADRRKLDDWQSREETPVKKSKKKFSLE